MKIRKDWGRSEGFTIVEVLMALFISLILLAAVYASTTSAQRSSAGVERKVAAQQDVRAMLDVMAIEISMASYNPNFIPAGIWKIPPPLANACVGTSANQAWKGIQEATPTSLTLEMDIGASNDIGDNPNEIIRYAYDAANQYILRNSNCAGSLPFLGDVSGAVQGTRTVLVTNGTAGMQINNGNNVPAVFRYYDGKNPATELYPDITPADIVNIRRIDITLGVQTEEVDPSTRQPRRMIYSTSVLVRNHVLN